MAKRVARGFGSDKEDRYQRAYIDFFEDRLVDRGYDWKGLVGEYLFKGDGPLINNLIAGRK